MLKLALYLDRLDRWSWSLLFFLSSPLYRKPNQTHDSTITTTTTTTPILRYGFKNIQLLASHQCCQVDAAAEPRTRPRGQGSPIFPHLPYHEWFNQEVWGWLAVGRDGRADVTVQNSFLFQKYKTATTCKIEWKNELLGTSAKVWYRPVNHSQVPRPTLRSGSGERAPLDLGILLRRPAAQKFSMEITLKIGDLWKSQHVGVPWCRQACLSHHQIVVWIWQIQPIYK